MNKLLIFLLGFMANFSAGSTQNSAGAGAKNVDMMAEILRQMDIADLVLASGTFNGKNVKVDGAKVFMKIFSNEQIAAYIFQADEKVMKSLLNEILEQELFQESLLADFDEKNAIKDAEVLKLFNEKFADFSLSEGSAVFAADPKMQKSFKLHEKWANLAVPNSNVQVKISHLIGVQQEDIEDIANGKKKLDPKNTKAQNMTLGMGEFQSAFKIDKKDVKSGKFLAINLGNKKALIRIDAITNMKFDAEFFKKSSKLIFRGFLKDSTDYKAILTKIENLRKVHKDVNKIKVSYKNFNFDLALYQNIGQDKDIALAFTGFVYFFESIAKKNSDLGGASQEIIQKFLREAWAKKKYDKIFKRVKEDFKNKDWVQILQDKIKEPFFVVPNDSEKALNELKNRRIDTDSLLKKFVEQVDQQIMGSEQKKMFENLSKEERLKSVNNLIVMNSLDIISLDIDLMQKILDKVKTLKPGEFFLEETSNLLICKPKQKLADFDNNKKTMFDIFNNKANKMLLGNNFKKEVSKILVQAKVIINQEDLNKFVTKMIWFREQMQKAEKDKK